MKPLVAGNWKMNGRAVSIVELDGIITRYDSALLGKVDLMLCPPATLTARFADRAVGTGVEIAGQDCHIEDKGAHTGDISAEMLRDAGASAVLVGHSERRTDHGETDEIVRAKAEAARRAGLVAIVCVGETAAERHAGDALTVVGAQLNASLPPRMTSASLVIAYEPVWAIGTGLTPTAADVAQVHGFIRARLIDLYGPEGRNIRILYGGSVKPANAKELLSVADVNGALVGGASLKAADFMAIAEAYR